MKRRNFIKGVNSLFMVGVGLFFPLVSIGKDVDNYVDNCDYDVYFIKMPRMSKEFIDKMVRDMNEKFKDDNKVFIAMCMDDVKKVEVVVAKELKGSSVNEVVSELRKDFLKIKNT